MDDFIKNTTILLDSIAANPLATVIVGGLLVAFITYICRKILLKSKNKSMTFKPDLSKNFGNFTIGNNDIQGDTIVFQRPSDAKSTICDSTLYSSSERAELPQRLQSVLDSMNTERSVNEKINVSKLASIVGDKSAEYLINCFEGQAYPDYEYLDKFCRAFAINDEWLKFGRGKVFSRYKVDSIRPENSYKTILESKPKSIYFVLSKTPQHAVTLILETSDLNYQVASFLWHLDLDHVGATGKSQMVSFWRLTEMLYSSVGLCCEGLVLSVKDWKLLVDGDIWPGTLCEKYRLSHSYWADDFIDIFHYYPIAENYEARYGSWFLETQSFIKTRLSE